MPSESFLAATTVESEYLYPSANSAAEPGTSRVCIASRGSDFFVLRTGLASSSISNDEWSTLHVGRLEKQENQDDSGIVPVHCFPCIPAMTSGAVAMRADSRGKNLLIADLHRLFVVEIPTVLNLHSMDSSLSSFICEGSFNTVSSTLHLDRVKLGPSGSSFEVRASIIQNAGGLEIIGDIFGAVNGKISLSIVQGGANALARGQDWQGSLDEMPLHMKVLSVEAEDADGENLKVKCTFGRVGVALVCDLHSLGIVGRILQAEWHPSCPNHVCLLTEDSHLLLVDSRKKNLDVPDEDIDLSFLKSSASDAVVAFQFACSAALQTTHTMGKYTVYAVFASGAIVAVCPFAGNRYGSPVPVAEASLLHKNLLASEAEEDEGWVTNLTTHETETLHWAAALNGDNRFHRVDEITPVPAVQVVCPPCPSPTGDESTCTGLATLQVPKTSLAVLLRSWSSGVLETLVEREEVVPKWNLHPCEQLLEPARTSPPSSPSRLTNLSLRIRDSLARGLGSPGRPHPHVAAASAATTPSTWQIEPSPAVVARTELWSMSATHPRRLTLFRDVFYPDMAVCLEQTSGETTLVWLPWLQNLGKALAEGSLEAKGSSMWGVRAKLLAGAATGTAELTPGAVQLVAEPGNGHFLISVLPSAVTGSQGSSELVQVDLAEAASSMRIAESFASAMISKPVHRSHHLTTEPSMTTEEPSPADLLAERALDLRSAVANVCSTAGIESICDVRFTESTPLEQALPASEYLAQVHASLTYSKQNSSDHQVGLMGSIEDAFEELREYREKQTESINHAGELLMALSEDLETLRSMRADMKDVSEKLFQLSKVNQEAVADAMDRARLLNGFLLGKSSSLSKAEQEHRARLEERLKEVESLRRKLHGSGDDGLLRVCEDALVLEEDLGRREEEQTPLGAALGEIAPEQEKSIRDLVFHNEQLLGLMLPHEEARAGRYSPLAQYSVSDLRARVVRLRKELHPILSHGAPSTSSLVCLVAAASDASANLLNHMQTLEEEAGFRLYVDRRLLSRSYQSSVRRTYGLNAVACPYNVETGRGKDSALVHLVLLNNDVSIALHEVQQGLVAYPQQKQQRAILQVFCETSDTAKLDLVQVEPVRFMREEPVVLCLKNADFATFAADVIERSAGLAQTELSCFSRIGLQ